MLKFYVGGYGMPGESCVLKCAFDGEGFRVLDACDGLYNPSWVLHHPDRPLLYAVEERSPEGGLAVLSEADGPMRVVARASTGGADPCHIAITPDARHLMVSNYTGGSLAVYALDRDGMPTRRTDFIQHRMDAPRRANPLRQDAPHIHFSLCDGRHVYVNDLGMNRTFIYGWDPGQGRLIDLGRSLDFPEGAGPRHLCFGADGRFMYVLCELDATLHVFQGGGADWRRVQVASTVPEDFTDFQKYTWSVAAAIHLSGPATLWASNRGHNSLAVFDIGPDGLLGPRRSLPSGGKTPRDFMAAGDTLLVANQDSGTLQAFVRTSDGYARKAESALAPHPTCLCR